MAASVLERRRRRVFTARGVTLVEIVAVVVILGIVSATAAPRLLDDRSFLARGYYDELVTALGYAQKIAVASGCPVRVVIDAEGYEARRAEADEGRCEHAEPGWTAAAALMGNQLLTGSAPLGVLVSPALTVTFDAFGRTDLAADRTILVGPLALTVHADGAGLAAR